MRNYAEWGEQMQEISVLVYYIEQM